MERAVSLQNMMVDGGKTRIEKLENFKDQGERVKRKSRNKDGKCWRTDCRLTEEDLRGRW